MFDLALNYSINIFIYSGGKMSFHMNILESKFKEQILPKLVSQKGVTNTSKNHGPQNIGIEIAKCVLWC